MRKLLLLVAVWLALPGTAAKAQYYSIGPVAGFGHSWISNTQTDTRFHPSPSLGIGMVYSRYLHWGFGADLVFSDEGMSYRVAAGSGMSNQSLHALYLRLPMKAYYFFGNYGSTVRPKVYLGPSVGVKIDEASRAGNGDLVREKPAMVNAFDLGLQAGAGVNIRIAKKTWLNLDLGYYQGLLDALDDGAGRYNTNQNLRLNAGVLFGF